MAAPIRCRWLVQKHGTGLPRPTIVVHWPWFTSRLGMKATATFYRRSHSKKWISRTARSCGDNALANRYPSMSPNLTVRLSVSPMVVPRDQTKHWKLECRSYAVYLLNRAKREGFGTRLVRRVMDQFVASGAASACVWALRDAIPARRFYEHHGAEFAAEKVENRDGYERVVVGYVWRDLRQGFGAVTASDLG